MDKQTRQKQNDSDKLITSEDIKQKCTAEEFKLT